MRSSLPLVTYCIMDWSCQCSCYEACNSIACKKKQWNWRSQIVSSVYSNRPCLKCLINTRKKCRHRCSYIYYRSKSTTTESLSSGKVSASSYKGLMEMLNRWSFFICKCLLSVLSNCQDQSKLDYMYCRRGFYRRVFMNYNLKWS